MKFPFTVQRQVAGEAVVESEPFRFLVKASDTLVKASDTLEKNLEKNLEKTISHPFTKQEVNNLTTEIMFSHFKFIHSTLLSTGERHERRLDILLPPVALRILQILEISPEKFRNKALILEDQKASAAFVDPGNGCDPVNGCHEWL